MENRGCQGSVNPLYAIELTFVTADLLLMRFTLIDPEDPAREFSICVDVNQQHYSGSLAVGRSEILLSLALSVPSCSPPLGILPELVDTLNRDRDFFTFIKAGTFPAPK